MKSLTTPLSPLSKGDDGKNLKRVILVGTYKGEQLSRWPGWYNYPITADDKISESDFGNITELWLFNGTREQKTYAAEFVGIETRETLIEKYGYPSNGRAHGGAYLLFKTTPLYSPSTSASGEDAKVIVRLKDFSTSPNVQKAWRQYLQSSERESGAGLSKRLPDALKNLPPGQLCVCESAFQLDLFTHMATPNTRGAIRVLELFAGVGGFRIGLERASKRYRTIWSNQWEPSTKRQDASMIYQTRFGVEGHSNEDIAKVSAGDIPQADLLVGGFPCQDYSVATTLKNSGGIEGKKGVLWWQIHRILRDSAIPPKYLFLENVDRLLKSPAKQRGRDFAIILASLADLGYAVEWRVINAAEYGMAQRRRRVYIIAYRDGTALNNEAARSDPKAWILEKSVIANAFPCVEKLRSPLQAFPIEGALPDITKHFNNARSEHCSFESAGIMVRRRVWTLSVAPAYVGPQATLGEILVDESDVPGTFFIDEKALAEWRYLKGAKSEMRKTKDGFEYRYSEGGMTFPDALDKPSRTIITGEGGTSPSRFKHVIQTSSGRYRRLVPVELERLNMFPDNHTSGASAGRRAFLMGNALVTGIVERIGKELAHRM